jgi:hypothetical protein
MEVVPNRRMSEPCCAGRIHRLKIHDVRLAAKKQERERASVHELRHGQ